MFIIFAIILLSQFAVLAEQGTRRHVKVYSRSQLRADSFPFLKGEQTGETTGEEIAPETDVDNTTEGQLPAFFDLLFSNPKMSTRFLGS